MKKIYLLFISLLMFIPYLANAETLEYNICKSGCEYSELEDVLTELQEKGNNNEFDNHDIIINFNDEESYDINSHTIGGQGTENINSFTINGNGNSINSQRILYIMAKKITINNIKNSKSLDNETYLNISDIVQHFQEESNISIFTLISNTVEINNSDLLYIYVGSNNQNNCLLTLNSSKINLIMAYNIQSNDSDVGFIGGESNNSLKTYEFNNTKLNGFVSGGSGSELLIENANIEANNCTFRNGYVLVNSTANIHNSTLNKIINSGDEGNTKTINIYNSKITGVKYAYVSNEDDANSVVGSNFNPNDTTTWPLDILDLLNNTYVHYDDTITLKPGETIDLKDKFGFDNDDLWSLEDNIGEISGNILTATKEGETNLILNADKDHFLYNIKVVVEKETIPEKIDKMTIKVPITGSKVKAWVVVISVLLLGVIGTCTSMLVRKKK